MTAKKQTESTGKHETAEDAAPPQNRLNGQSAMKPFIMGYDRRIAFYPRFMSMADERAILEAVKESHKYDADTVFAAKRAGLIVASVSAPQIIPGDVRNPKIADFPAKDSDIEKTVREIFPEYSELDDRLLTNALDLIITMCQPSASFG